MGLLGSWLGEFICNITQIVIFNGKKSSISNIRSGVPQRGPLLFLIYVRDFADDTSANALTYVDDVKVKEKVNNMEDVEKFQEKLNKLYKWDLENNCIYNNEKFLVLRYGTDSILKED